MYLYVDNHKINYYYYYYTGECKHFDRRALLLYDGIHYDPLVIMDNDETILQTTFPVSNEAVMFEAIDIASQACQVNADLTAL